jgi:hypothetical protein
MSTTTVGGTGAANYDRQSLRLGSARLKVGRFGIGTIGTLTVLISAWGGIVPYIGPLFGYSADGAGSWYWNLAHAILGLAPGAIGVVMGLVILSRTSGVIFGRGRISLATAGLIALLCGAWFVIGPLAWPVITNHRAYFVTASPLRALANEIGYSLGTGVILAACGAFAIGWATRHQSTAAAQTGVVDEVPDES